MSRLLMLSLVLAVLVVVMATTTPGSSIAGDIGRRGPSPNPCADHDVPCQMLRAAEAEREGRSDDADAIYRRILAAHPLMDEPYTALVRLREQQSLSKISQPYRETRDLLDATFREYETRRFIVLSNADASWSRTQAEYLERAHHQFMRFASRLNLRPLPLKHKLVCVLFERQRDYRAFAAAHDGILDPWIVGHYSPSHDRVVFFHRSEEDQPDRPSRAAIATTIHEAIHQLHFHTRVKSINVQYPLWICEGLATAFETDAPNQAFGPDHEYSPRRDRFQLLLKDDQLLPLRDMVAVTQLDANRQDTVAALYHQSYAFVTWANRFRSAQLREYLNAMLQEPPGQVNEHRHLAIFQQTFGNIEAIEQQWLNHERRLLAKRSEFTPDALEEHASLRACACGTQAFAGHNWLSYRLMAHARLSHK